MPDNRKVIDQLTRPDGTVIPVVKSECAVCGKKGDDYLIHLPAEHVWQQNPGTIVVGPSFHADCLVPEFEAMLGTDETHPMHANTREAIKLARSGIRGQALRDALAKLPSDNHWEAVVDKNGNHAGFRNADPALQED